MRGNKIVKTENMPSAVLDVYEDGSGRVTFFNERNHWHGEIFLTKEQIDFYYSEEYLLSLMYIPKIRKSRRFNYLRDFLCNILVILY